MKIIGAIIAILITGSTIFLFWRLISPTKKSTDKESDSEADGG